MDLWGASTGYLWHAIPIILGISLVYAATRHERMADILYSSYRTAQWIVSFIAVVVAILMVISWWV